MCGSIVIWAFFLTGMSTEGIYRIPGNKLQVELLQSKLQDGESAQTLLQYSLKSPQESFNCMD